MEVGITIKETLVYLWFFTYKDSRFINYRHAPITICNIITGLLLNLTRKMCGYPHFLEIEDPQIKMTFELVIKEGDQLEAFTSSINNTSIIDKFIKFSFISFIC